MNVNYRVYHKNKYTHYSTNESIACKNCETFFCLSGFLRNDIAVAKRYGCNKKKAIVTTYIIHVRLGESYTF